MTHSAGVLCCYSQANCNGACNVQRNPAQQGDPGLGGHDCPCIEQLPVLAVAVPVRETVCGLPGAVSAIETVPFRVPVVVGEKITLMVQFVPDARVEPQVLVS